MLVLSRRVGETVWIGDVASVVINSIDGETVSLGISTRSSVELIDFSDTVLSDRSGSDDDVVVVAINPSASLRLGRNVRIGIADLRHADRVRLFVDGPV